MRELQDRNGELSRGVAELRAHLDRTGALTVYDLEQQREELQRQIIDLRDTSTRERREALAQLDAQLVAGRAEGEAQLRDLARSVGEARAELDELRRSVVATTDEQLLQEVGVYEFRHPLDDAVAYKAELDDVRGAMKAMARADGGAVTGATGWTVNGSEAQGRKMVRENCKLMLRAYNSEADALVRGLKPYKLDGAVSRLTKSREVIAKLGRTMSIEVSPRYHRLRIRELELTADYLAKVAEEKEREREEKARLREERKAQQELQRERERLDKERQHYANALASLESKGDLEAAGKLRAQLDDVDRAINDVDYRAANIRAGYVYVISNVGAFGERMIKVGMTRRLEPLDRVRELGDASVPFRFDVHALFFANDAVGIETAMHQRLADRRVNMVNLRREFFYATPQEAREHLLDLAGDLLEYVEDPEALEFRQSQPDRASSGVAAEVENAKTSGTRVTAGTIPAS
ncbi:DUF4041 domain-containing protein [Patulibacter sp.]|uniref:DUF4041 domain-containing protein n=1 Tax=Patulibacter sp. TaxID=1912859 RepID=UPI002725906F|nr:DUF4041 domain-containing protein [Patulibacter sp.]MDO9406935.1 DUF4041 domain-containing protein [Patulibacter sp.]